LDHASATEATAVHSRTHTSAPRIAIAHLPKIELLLNT
jgi:hypothetical protein